MAVLHIIHSPDGRLTVPQETRIAAHLTMASLDIPDDLEGRDIYEIARKLSELLLEQLP